MKTIILALVFIFLTGCAHVTSSKKTLYDALGGQRTIDTISTEFVREISYSKAIRPYFAQTNVKRFQSALSQHLCMVTDGPCSYEGDDMAKIHGGMNITEADFNATVELMTNAMKTAGVSYPLQNKVLKRLAPMRRDIIGQ